MFLAAEAFPGFVHAGVRGFSLGGWRRLPPRWNYNYLSCLSNSSASRTRLAGAHTPIGSGEVRRNLTVCLDITQHSEAAHHPVTSSAANKGTLWEEMRRFWCVMHKQTLIFRLWCVYVHLSAWVWEPFEQGWRVCGALLSLLTHSEDSLSSPKVTFGGCVFRMRMRRLRKPTDI